MAETMVERVARAIEKAVREGYFTTGSDGMSMSRHAARAAIEAMREPTEAMADAPSHAGVRAGDYTMHSGEAEEAWRAMVDSALAPALQDEESG